MGNLLEDYINSNGNYASSQNNYGQMPQYNGNLQNFLQQYQQVQQANQALNQGSIYAKQVDGSLGSRRNFSLGGGTEGLYNSWQQTSIPDQLAIAAEQGAEWWNQLPAQIAGAIGGEQAKQDWTFDANKFNLANGFDGEDLNQIKNFALSLPGMMVGGTLEGLGDLYEAGTGRPINEYRVGQNGAWEIPDYQLDASQRAADLLDAAINIGGTFTGGAGRVVGGGAKAAAKAASGISKTQAKTLNRIISGEITEAEGMQALSAGADELKKLRSKYDKALHRQDLMSGMSKGIVTRAAEKTAGKELGTAAGIVSDMGDEAAEEFIQSYAEDVRNKNIDEGSLDRALTGAAWGAAGGLLMGAGGRLISSASNFVKPEAQQASNTNVTPDYSSKEDWDSLRDGYGASSYMWNDAAVEALEDANSNGRRATAAAIYTMTETDTSLGIGKSRLGVWNVKKVFEQGDKDQEFLAEAFGTTVPKLREILYSSNNAAAELTALAKALPRGSMQVCIGRNPDTKNGGFYIDVSEFVDGEHFALHPLVAGVIGADWDGDTASVYFNPNRLNSDDENYGNVMTPIGYFSEILANPETHRSNIEWIWGGLTGDAKVDSNKLHALVIDHLGRFGGEQVDNGNGGTSSLIEITKKEIEDALALEDTKDRDAALSVAFSNIVTRINTIDRSQGHLIVEGMINDFLMDDVTIVRRIIGQIVDSSITNIFGSAGIDMGSKHVHDTLDSLKSSIESEWSRGSTTGGNTKTFQMSKSLGLLTYLANMGGKYNPIYRQYGGLKFHVNSVELIADALVNEANTTSTQSTILNAVRSAFRLAQPGQDPTTAVESLCDRMAYTKLVQEMHLGSRRLVSKDDFDEFEKKMVEVFSGYARIYDLTRPKESSDGLYKARDDLYRTAIDGIKADPQHPDKDIFVPFDGTLDEKQKSMLWRQFHRVFDERPMLDLFDRETCEALGAYDGMTFGEYFELVTTYTTDESLYMFLSGIRSYNPELASWFINAARTFGSEADAVVASIENELSSSYYNFSGIRQRYIDNNNHIDPRDVPMIIDYMNVVWSYIGNDALDLRLICSDEFFGSALGQMLFSDDASQRINAIASLGIRAQFAVVTDAFFSGDEQSRINAIQDLNALATISPLHRSIADDILEYESTDLLEWASSLKLSLLEKETYYNDTVGLVFSKRSFLLNCLQDVGGKFAVSSVSAKNKTAMQARAKMVKNSWDTSRREVEAFFSIVDTYTSGSRDPGSLLENWFMDRGKHARIKLRADILGMKVATSLTVDNGYIEKATIPELYSMLYNSAELANVGTLLGKMDEALSTNSGHINKSQFLGNRVLFVACATDPEFRLWVYDEDLHENVLMTQKRLFESVKSIKDSGGFVGPKPTAAQIKALFMQYPHVASYFCQPSISVVTKDADTTTSVTRVSDLQTDFINWATPQTATNADESEGSEQVSQEEIRNVETSIENIKSLYYDDANAQTIITAIACKNHPGLLDGRVSLREIVREIDKAADEYARFQQVRHYQLEPNVTSEAKAKTDLAITERRIGSLIKTVWRSLARALESKTLTTKEALTKQQADLIMGDFFTAAIMEELRHDTGKAFSFEPSYDKADADYAVKNLSQVIQKGFQIVQWMVSQYQIALDDSMTAIMTAFVDHQTVVSGIANNLRAEAADAAIKAEALKPAGQARRSDDEIRRDIAADKKYDDDAEALYVSAVENLSFVDHNGNTLSLFDQPAGLLSEQDLLTETDAASSMRKLLVDTGFYSPDTTDIGIIYFPEIEEMVQADVAQMFENGVVNIAARNAIIDKYNKIWMRHLLQEMSAMAGGLEVNENMFQLSDQLDQAICDSMTYLDERLQDGTLPDNTFGSDVAQIEKVYKKKGWVFGKIPEMDYSSQTLQSSISNQISANPASKNSLAVGVNGAQQKQGFAVGHLPAKIDDLEYSYVLPVPKSDIDNDFSHYRGMFAQLPGRPDPAVIGSLEFQQYLATVDDDTELIQVFDPSANPHGLPTYNMMAGHRFANPMKDYHRLSGILGMVADYTMEQMVMKAKKRMAIVNEISVMRGAVGNSQHQSLSISDVNQAFDTVNAAFQSFRNDFCSRLEDEFSSDEMKDLNFGQEQALILTQALTPGVLLEVEYRVPGASGVETGFIMVDASVFFDSIAGRDARTKFAELINQHEPPIASIKNAEVQVLTLQELSSRIMDKISDVSGTPVHGTRQTRPTIQQTEDAARDALANWTDYSDRYSGSVSNLVYQFPPIGLETRTPIFASDNPVPPQILAGLTSNNVFGNSDTRFDKKPVRGTLVKGTHEYDAATSIGRELGLVAGKSKFVATSSLLGSGLGSAMDIQELVPYPITRVWASARDSSLDLFDDDEVIKAFNAANATIVQNGLENQDYYGSYGICNDPDQINNAIAWAKRTGSVLFFTENCSGNIAGGMLPGQYSQDEIETELALSHSKIKWTIYDGKAGRKSDSYLAGKPSSGCKYKSRDSIWLTGVFDSEREMPAGLESLRSGDAARFLFPRGMRYKLRDPNEFVEIDIRTIFPEKTSGPRRFITVEEARNLLPQLATTMINGHYTARSDWSIFENAGFRISDYATAQLDGASNTEAYRQKVVKYLEHVATSDADTQDSFVHGAPHQNEVAGLITDGVHIYPVFYPRKMPEDVLFCNVELGLHGMVAIDFGGESSPAGAKMNTMGAPSKGMAMPPNGVDASPAIALDGYGLELHDCVMSESESSRFAGLEKKALIDLLSRIRALNMSNLFFRQDPRTGEISFSPAVSRWPVRYKRMLLSNADCTSLWAAIEAGTLTFSDDSRSNELMQKVFTSLRSYGQIDPRTFFGDFIVTGTTDDAGNIVNKRVTYLNDGAGGIGWAEWDFYMVFQDFEYEDILKIYHTVDPVLCSDGYYDGRKRNQYIIAADGSARVIFDDGKEYRMYVRAGNSEVLKSPVSEHTPSGRSSVSPQHIGRRASDIGYTEGTLQKGVNDNYIAARKYSEAKAEYDRKKAKAYTRERQLPKYSEPRHIALAGMFPSATNADIKETKAVSEVLGKTWGSGPRTITKDGGKKKITNLNDDIIGTELQIPVSKFRTIMKAGRGSRLNIEIVDGLSKCNEGASWTEDMAAVLDDEGRWSQSEGEIARNLDMIVKNILAGRLPVVASPDGAADVNGRYPMGLIPQSLAKWLWSNLDDHAIMQINGRGFQSIYHNNFDEFVKAMKHEQELCEKNVKKISENVNGGTSKQRALLRLSRALWISYGDTSHGVPITGSYYLPELTTDIRSMVAAMAHYEGWSDESAAAFEALVTASDEQYTLMRDHLAKIGYLQVTTNNNGTEEIKGYNRIQEAKDIVNILNNLAETSKVMAVLNPFLSGGNIADRMFHQGAARLWLWMGNSLRIGPYKSDKNHVVDSKIRKMSVESQVAIALYQSMREMEFTNEEYALLAELAANKSEQAILEFVENRKKEINAKFPGRVRDFAYKAASGGTIGIKMQMETVIDRFVQFAEENGEDFWFEPVPNQFNEDGSPMTFLENMLNLPGGFANLMQFCLNTGTPSYMTFLQAMNSAKAGDIAQKNALWMFIQDVLRRIPLSNFLVTTSVARFPAYGLNVTGRILNYLLPISSMRRAFIEFTSKTQWGKEIGIEQANIHASMREAIMVDMCKMGVGGVAILLFGISGALQPPDDERKWGNIDEWLVFGMRAGETWWLEDMLGMALPLACFWKSCEQGKPRLDIITNGVMNACYSNPMIRVADMAEWILNPAESLVSDYNDEIVQFSNAKGGPPSFAQYLQSNMFSLGMNWLTQFCTPSILKEWWRSSYSLEKSYKRDWERSSTGQITDAGRNGATEYVTYDEAIKRKLALRNPVLAYMFSLGDKSYMPADMPDTIYYDEYQLGSMNTLSISGLDAESRNAQVAYLLSILSSYDDMQELANDGFHLDYETLNAVASQVWDNYHAVDEWYNNLQANGQLDYYVLGDGDWAEGQRIAGELKKERDSAKQYWYDFYYNKLKNSPISKSLVTYNRYNTTYAEDVYGEVYATGQMRSPLNMLPFVGAPGSLANPEGTAGYENDFTTVSAVTGLPLSQRALIPSESGRIELPDFEEFSATGDGGSYSNWHYDSTGTTPTSSKNTSASTTSSGKPGGSGGSGGSGGGGGRSYVPNTSNPSTSISKSNVSRVMNTDRLIKPDEYYLRPDFETKGSREAYKRSDI